MGRTIADVMATELVTLSPDTTIVDAIYTLLQRRFSGAPVVDANGELVGMLSQKDCLRTAFSARYHGDWSGRVADFMSAPVQTLDADMDLVSAAQHFLDAPYRRFPVMRGDRLVGQVSRRDILQALSGS